MLTKLSRKHKSVLNPRGRHGSQGGGGVDFLPSDLPNLELWTQFNKGITVTGAGVSTWADQSGNGNDLLQGTDANRPSKESDGSILFDGVSEFLKTAPFTLNQPETIYILGKQVSWANGDRICDGEASNSGAILQRTTSPDIESYAGSFSGANSDFILGAYAVLTVIFNGASSILQIDNNAPVTSDPGVANLGGFTLGTNGAASSQWSNIQVKECAIYTVAHDAATRTSVINYLNSL